MMSTQPASAGDHRQTGAERTRRWRERMRAKGLVPRTVWTYDVNDPAFRARLEADCAKIKGSEQERRILEEIEVLTDWTWTPARYAGDGEPDDDAAG